MLTIKNVLKILLRESFPSSKAFILGLFLNVPGTELKALAAGNSNDDDGLLSGVISYWLQNDLNQSWDALASAVFDCRYVSVADVIRREMNQGITPEVENLPSGPSKKKKEGLYQIAVGLVQQCTVYY